MCLLDAVLLSFVWPTVGAVLLLSVALLQWVDAKRLFQEAADLMDYDRKKLKTMWAQFWASHQVGASLIVVFSAAHSMSMCNYISVYRGSSSTCV